MSTDDALATTTPAVGTDATAPAGGTVWLTGLSGAGKSTIAHALADRLRSRGRVFEILDGDELRENLSPGLGFGRADRDAHVTRVGYLARMLARHGVLSVVPVIAPYADTRAAVAAAHRCEGVAYVEVHVATSVEECARRDVKGLYAKQAAGELSHLTGVDDPYDIPENPDLRLDTTGSTPETEAEAILALLSEKGLL